MSSYLGNQKLVLMEQGAMPVANYEVAANPTTTINPTRVPVSWLNTTTGVIWVCIDNTTDANVWVGETDWESFALSCPITNVTWTARKRRVGKNMEIEALGTFTGAGTGSANITIPDGLSIASGVIGVSGFAQGMLGYIDYFDTTTGYHYQGTAVTLDATTLRLSVTHVIGSFTRLGSVDPTGNPFATASGDTYAIKIIVPIEEWQ